jgi:uncharacterized protein (TIGR02217 family)
VAEPIFPSLATQGWSVIKTATFSTRTQKSVSGRELRLADQTQPIWEWTLTYEVLRDSHDFRGAGPGVGYDELRTLAGFYLARRGSFEAFLFSDQSDNYIANQYLGTGDGVQTVFQLYRTFGGYAEPITAPSVVSIYDSGLAMPASAFGVDINTGLVYFVSPPIAGHVLTVDMAYYHRVRFSDDSSEYENFLYQLWSAREVKLRSVLP